jgi:CRP-like cAMP-binding protein
MSKSLMNTPYRRLPEAVHARLMRRGRKAAYSDGELIHERGDTEIVLSLVCNGAVRLSNVGLSGKRIAAALLTRGEVYGVFQLFSGEPYSHDAHAVGETQIIMFSDAAFRAALDAEPDLRDFMIAFLSHRLVRAMELLEDERRLTLPVRLAKRLLAKGGKDGTTIAITQADLAQELGVSRYALGTALADLSRSGLLLTSYGRIVVPKRSRLSAWVRQRSDIAYARRQ